MKKNKTLIRELKKALHYYQMMVRIDMRAVQAGKAKCRLIAEIMRELQRQGK